MPSNPHLTPCKECVYFEPLVPKPEAASLTGHCRVNAPQVVYVAGLIKALYPVVRKMDIGCGQGERNA